MVKCVVCTTFVLHITHLPFSTMRFLNFLLGAPDAPEVLELPEVAALPKAGGQTTSELIEEIHRSFNSVGDKLLADAQATLAGTDAVSLQKGARLAAAGFVNTRQVKQTQQQAAKAAEARELQGLILAYALRYPTNKFITRQHVDQIAAKYNLVVGDTSAYTGFVPDKNLREIEAFNSRFQAGDKPVEQIRITAYKYDSIRTSENSQARALFPDGLVSLNDDRLSLGSSNAVIYPGPLGKRSHELAFIDNYERVNSSAQLICAPAADMDLSQLKQQNGHWFKTTQVHVPDPVVLQPVKGGYLIVTAWGDEASDPLVVNHQNN